MKLTFGQLLANWPWAKLVSSQCVTDMLVLVDSNHLMNDPLSVVLGTLVAQAESFYGEETFELNPMVGFSRVLLADERFTWCIGY